MVSPECCKKMAPNARIYCKEVETGEKTRNSCVMVSPECYKKMAPKARIYCQEVETGEETRNSCVMVSPECYKKMAPKARIYCQEVEAGEETRAFLGYSMSQKISASIFGCNKWEYILLDHSIARLWRNAPILAGYRMIDWYTREQVGEKIGSRTLVPDW